MFLTHRRKIRRERKVWTTRPETQLPERGRKWAGKSGVSRSSEQTDDVGDFLSGTDRMSHSLTT